MDAAMGLLMFVSMIAIVVGLIMCVFRAKRAQGKQVAFYGTAGFLFVFSFALFQGPKPSSAEHTSAQAAVSAVPARPTYKQVLSQLQIRSLTWEKDGFGMIMKASFVIQNNSSIDVKDIVVTCRHSANSGTKIDSNTRTVYEVVNHQSSKPVIDFNMGFVHSQIVRSECNVTDYSTVG